MLRARDVLALHWATLAFRRSYVRFPPIADMGSLHLRPMTVLAPDEPRRLSRWLLANVLWLPVIYSWITLRGGYSQDVRIGAFRYLGLAVLLGVFRNG